MIEIGPNLAGAIMAGAGVLAVIAFFWLVLR